LFQETWELNTIKAVTFAPRFHRFWPLWTSREALTFLGTQDYGYSFLLVILVESAPTRKNAKNVTQTGAVSGRFVSFEFVTRTSNGSQIPPGSQLGPSWVPAGSQLGPSWVPAGYPAGSQLGTQLGHSWVPAGSQLGSSWVPAEFQLGSSWVPAQLGPSWGGI